MVNLHSEISSLRTLLTAFIEDTSKGSESSEVHSELLSALRSFASDKAFFSSQKNEIESLRERLAKSTEEVCKKDAIVLILEGEIKNAEERVRSFAERYKAGRQLVS